MKKLNNNGFAITSIIYSMLLLAIMLMTITIIALARKQILINNNKNKVYDKFDSFYTVNYNCNGGIGTMESSKLRLNSWQKLSKINCRHGTLKFKGWSLTSNGNVEYTNRAKVYNLANKDETIDLYAIWGTWLGTSIGSQAGSYPAISVIDETKFLYTYYNQNYVHIYEYTKQSNGTWSGTSIGSQAGIYPSISVIDETKFLYTYYNQNYVHIYEYTKQSNGTWSGTNIGSPAGIYPSISAIDETKFLYTYYNQNYVHIYEYQ